jgi:hypothetical protein
MHKIKTTGAHMGTMKSKRKAMNANISCSMPEMVMAEN